MQRHLELRSYPAALIIAVKSWSCEETLRLSAKAGTKLASAASGEAEGLHEKMRQRAKLAVLQEPVQRGVNLTKQIKGPIHVCDLAYEMC